MSSPKEDRKDKRLGVELRTTSPDAIAAYVKSHFDSQVGVEFAPKEETITIPSGWHGAGKEGEVFVYVGDMLTEPIAGTKLRAIDFAEWMVGQGFSLVDNQDKAIDPSGAASILESANFTMDKTPLVRLTRGVGRKVPVEIQFYAGAVNPWVKRLSEIGNRDLGHVSQEDRVGYRLDVQELFRPFISKGSKEERVRLGLRKNVDTVDTVDILRRVDDCAASMVTIVGDQLVDDEMNISRENLLEIHDVSVATLQAVVIAIAMAERRHVPLLMRVGAPAFGLGSKEGLNYMMNTLPEMQAHGAMVVGDMGTLMDEGDSADASPQALPVRGGDASRERRLFLGGGLPVSKMLEGVHHDRGKPMGWDITFRRASRVDNGPKHWGALISGTNLTVRTARRDKSFIPPDTELVTHENEPWIVEKAGLWGSIGSEEGGYITITFTDRGDLRTLYLPAKAKQ